MTGVRHWSICFLSGRRTLEVTVTNITEFFDFLKIFLGDFRGPFYPSTPGLKLCCH